jgi:hypothetical protein
LETEGALPVAEWRVVRAEVDRLVDGRGKKVDAGIKEAVIALRAFGFPTYQSCQGHRDWGLLYPWVDITLEGTGTGDLPKAFTCGNLGEQRRMLSLLDDFYRDRSVEFDAMLTIQDLRDQGAFRLHCVGGPSLRALSRADRDRRRRVYRSEFDAFAQFLRARYVTLDGPLGT